MDKNVLPVRSKDGKKLNGSISLGGKKAPKPKSVAEKKIVGLPLKAQPVSSTKDFRNKPTYVVPVNKNPFTTKLGTTEHIIAQAQRLTEDKAVALWHMTRSPDISWGLAQNSAMEIFDSTGDKGVKRHAALQLKWDSNWPDFSKYYNDDAWDSAWNAMAWATVALELRGELPQKRYDALSKPWRLHVGQIHAGDLEMRQAF